MLIGTRNAPELCYIDLVETCIPLQESKASTGPKSVGRPQTEVRHLSGVPTMDCDTTANDRIGNN